MTDETTDGASKTAAPIYKSKSAKRKKRRFVVVIIVLLGALSFILVEGLGSSLNYFDTISQAESHRGSLGTSTFRLEGTVKNGTVVRTSKGATFTMTGGPYPLTIKNSGSPPELFQPGIPVVVVGHFSSTSSRVFYSNQILVKHSATYIAKYPTRVRPKKKASS
jgi:cytochrome c-type biogenesis protein CcmE